MEWGLDEWLMMLGRYCLAWGESREVALTGRTVELLAWTEALGRLEREQDARRWRVVAAAQGGLSREGLEEFRKHLMGPEKSAAAAEAREKYRELHQALMNVAMVDEAGVDERGADSGC